MADSYRRKQILEQLFARVQLIRTEHGYKTDAGRLVFLGEAFELGPDDPDVAIAIVVLDDDPTQRAEKVHIDLPIDFRALAKADQDQPWLAVEDIIGDIKRAVEQEDRTLGKLVNHPGLERRPTRTLPRAPGSETVGASLVYLAPYSEVWGAP